MKNYIVIDSTSKNLLGKNFSIDLFNKDSYIIPTIHPTMSFTLINNQNRIIVLLNSNLKITAKQI